MRNEWLSRGTGLCELSGPCLTFMDFNRAFLENQVYALLNGELIKIDMIDDDSHLQSQDTTANSHGKTK